MYKKSPFLVLAAFALYFVGATTTYASTLNCSSAVNINIPVNECQALLDLYDSTNGPSWSDNTNRDTDTDVATWFGVSTDGTNVVGLTLNNNNLNGTLPSSLSALSSIQFFYADGNQIGGTLPSSISTRTNIGEFNLSGNQLTGTLPDARSGWSNIYFINLSNNNLEGTLPSSRGNWSNMGYFYANNNNLEGTLPSSRSSWTYMWILNLADNQLEGTLPSSRSSWTYLRYFYLQNNLLSGPLPSGRSTWVNMRDFDVSNNFLSGFVPSSWYGTRPYHWFPYIQYDENCMQISGYSTGMQSWLNDVAMRIPQKDCTVNAPVILSPTSGEVLTTGNVFVSGTGEAGNIISVTLSGTTLTGTIDGSGLRSVLFSNITSDSYTISAFQTDYISTYNSDIVRRDFSIALGRPIKIKPVKTKVSKDIIMR